MTGKAGQRLAAYVAALEAGKVSQDALENSSAPSTTPDSAAVQAAVQAVLGGMSFSGAAQKFGVPIGRVSIALVLAKRRVQR